MAFHPFTSGSSSFQINDPIHGLIIFPNWVKLLIDTPEFQRLRDIKQLGLCSMVYPSAVHTRFSHSLGTAALAQDLVTHLEQSQVGVTPQDVMCVVIAALFHDLGHACYSHTFELFLKQVPKRSDTEAAILEEFSHEEMSKAYIREVLWNNPKVYQGLRALGLCIDNSQPLEHPLNVDLLFVLEMLGKPRAFQGACSTYWPLQGRGLEKAFLYEIVSNWRSGIDVDKLDYIARDGYFLNLPSSGALTTRRYIQGLQVRESPRDGLLTLSPSANDRDNLGELLIFRQTLHKKAYQHKKVRQLEFVMCDILCLIQEAQNVGLSLLHDGGREYSLLDILVSQNLKLYSSLTDDFLKSICFHQPLTPFTHRLRSAFQEGVWGRGGYQYISSFNLDTTQETEFREISCPQLAALAQQVYQKLRAEPQEEVSSSSDDELHASHLLPASQDIGPPSNLEETLDLKDPGMIKIALCNFHRGLKWEDPISRIAFHTKDECGFYAPQEVPMKQILYIYLKSSETINDSTRGLIFQALKKAKLLVDNMALESEFAEVP